MKIERSSSRKGITPTRLTKFAGRVFLLSFAMAHLWASRYQMNSDGISYLDIGDAFFHGNWRAISNLYWSPLYALVLGAVRRTFPVSMKWEYPVVHAVNFAIFVFLIIPSFEFFWGNIFQSNLSLDEKRPYPETAWWIAGYATLAVTANMQRAIEFVTPDLIMTGLFLLAAGLLVRVRASTAQTIDFLFLGAALGFGYLTKAPMLPVAFFFFVAAAAGRMFNSRHVLRLCAMVLAFALISTPLIFFLSQRKGGLTFGESSRLAFAWRINRVFPAHVFWEGEPSISGTPIHPPRQIWRSPDVYEFGSPIHATYPVWYDPSYWHEGVRVHFDARGLARVGVESLKAYLKILFEFQAPVLTIFLVLAALRADLTAMFRHLLKHWPVLLVAYCALGMFGAIWVEPRYVAACPLLLWPPLFLSTQAFDPNGARVARAAAFSLAVMVLPLLLQGVIAERQLDTRESNIETAVAVQQSGIHPGDEIAFIGDGIAVYWAKLDRVSIVAEIPNNYGWADFASVLPVARPFWQSTDSEQAAIYDALRKTDARAILALTPPSGVPKGWQQVGHSNLCVKFLR